MTVRPWQLLGVLVGLAVLLWAAGLLWFASTIPHRVEDTETRTDAIVVLTGGSERIETGLQLLAAGMAERLFVSGVGEQVRPQDILVRTGAGRPDLADSITVGNAANDTPGNAIETAAWVHAQEMRSIRLVTAAYHMRRSLLEFHAAMPGVLIVPHAVFPASVKSDWWRWPGTASLIAREYTKYILTRARQGFENGRAADLPGHPATQAVAHR